MTMMLSASQTKVSASRQQASNKKRKASPVIINKDANEVTKCKDFFKSNEGISLCSELIKALIVSRTKLTAKEMTAINDIMEYSSAYGQEFASDRCPAGGDVSWLASRDWRENLEREYLTVENASTAMKKPHFDPESLLNQILDFNKEHILWVEKRQKRTTAKPSRFSPSEHDEPVIPEPLNEAMFEFSEAMQHLDEAI
jgi:hypothetical protein